LRLSPRLSYNYFSFIRIAAKPLKSHAVLLALFCGVAVSAAFVFAEGASVACPADLYASVLTFNYFDGGDDNGFPHWLFIISSFPVKTWNRNRNK